MSKVDLVVVGLGYVGLPLAQEACNSGLSVVGLDVDAHTVARLNAGKSHIDDLSDADLGVMLQTGFRAVTDVSILAEANVIVICVPTPLGTDGGPDLSAVRAAGHCIATEMQTSALVVLESTTWPGTTEEVLLPLLEAGSGLKAGNDFNLAFSPERIDPGNAAFGLRNTPKVIGGFTPECGDRAERFYLQFVDEVVRAKGCREAEMAKLLENTYRHVNIALVNEMAKFSHDLDIDFWDVIRCAASKPFGFQAFKPGPGVGGHCIPIDPNYLSYRVRTELGYPFRFVELAQEVNQSMPAYVASRVQEVLNGLSLPVRGSAVCLLGVTYKADIGDERESPAIPLARRLLSWGAKVSYHDPYVDRWTVDGAVVERETEWKAAIEAADVAVLLQAHSQFDLAIIQTLGTVLDTRGAASGPGVIAL